jgi:hypothetical protein
MADAGRGRGAAPAGRGGGSAAPPGASIRVFFCRPVFLSLLASSGDQRELRTQATQANMQRKPLDTAERVQTYGLDLENLKFDLGEG